MSSSSENTHKNISLFLTVSMPLVVLAIGGLVNWVWKVDERQYMMSSLLPQTYASKSDLKEIIKQIADNNRIQFENFDQRLTDRTKQRERFEAEVLQQVKDTNKKVNELAIQIEKLKRD
ncbi:MAG: hypothetical protein JKY54_13240 [Flavobacteriales bacterium]|nr:hypothetical protein [Flavobacteriales bacterium]